MSGRRAQARWTALIVVAATFFSVAIAPVAAAPGAKATKPTLAVSITAPRGIADVEGLDRAAHTAQVALETATAKPTTTTGAWLAAANAAARAEHDLDVARDLAWDATTLPTANALLISRPLALAMLDLHIEVRRSVGGSFHTVVPGLVSDQGCRGDLVSERMLHVYGSSAAAPLGATASPTTDTLDALAHQIACLGAAQLAELEHALADGFDRVSQRMEQRNLDSLVPAFARLVAPVQVLVLDARKHRGAASRAWAWFSTYGPFLEQDVTRAGWATEKLLLWNRRQGVLVGYPPCVGKAFTPQCVDVLAFIKSLGDPQALGMGDCGLAGMVGRGPDQLKQGIRYTCPTQECQGTTKPAANGMAPTGTAPKGGLSTAQQQEIQNRWPQVTKNDLTQMGALCKGAGADMQGGTIDLGQCLGGEPETNPFEQNAACMVEAIGANKVPDIGGELKGVPMGNECRFADGAGTSTSAATPAQEEPKADEKPWYEKLRDLFTTSTGTATSTPEPKATPASTPQVRQLAEGDSTELSDDKAAVTITEIVDPKTGELVRYSIVVTGKLADAINLVASEAMEPDSDDLTLDTALNQLEDMYRKGQRDCVDPLACANTCTAVGQMITAAQACTDDLLSAIAKATGRPDKSTLVKKVDIASYPRPDGDTGPADEADGVCAFGDIGPSKQPASCGLILCVDGVAAAGLNGGCSCGGVAGLFQPADLCIGHRCADGTMPDAQCQCAEVGGYEPGRPPVPPITRINELGTMRTLGSTTLATTSADGLATRMLGPSGDPGMP
jgi:hypothetical protein